MFGNTIQEDRNTFFQACRTGELSILKKFSHEKIQEYINSEYAADNHSFTPFMIACREGQVEVVEWLLEQGADYYKKSTKDVSAFELAILRNHIAVLEKCKEVLGVNKLREPLQIALDNVFRDLSWSMSHLSAAVPLIGWFLAHFPLEQGSDIPFVYWTLFNQTVQHQENIAILKNFEKYLAKRHLQILLSHIPDPERQLTLLMYASMNGFAQTVDWLLKHGADPDYTTPRGDSVFDAAKSQTNEDVKKIILEKLAAASLAKSVYKNPLSSTNTIDVKLSEESITTFSSYLMYLCKQNGIPEHLNNTLELLPEFLNMSQDVIQEVIKTLAAQCLTAENFETATEFSFSVIWHLEDPNTFSIITPYSTLVNYCKNTRQNDEDSATIEKMQKMLKVYQDDNKAYRPTKIFMKMFSSKPKDRSFILTLFLRYPTYANQIIQSVDAMILTEQQHRIWTQLNEEYNRHRNYIIAIFEQQHKAISQKQLTISQLTTDLKKQIEEQNTQLSESLQPLYNQFRDLNVSNTTDDNHHPKRPPTEPPR